MYLGKSTHPMDPMTTFVAKFLPPQFFGVDLYQGIDGCTPTNVPLWEIPDKPYKYHGYTVRGTPNCPLNL